MAYYCDCVQSWKAKGHVLKSNPYTDAGIYKPQIVDVKQDDICVHCGHYAVWSKNPPATLQAYLQHAQGVEEESFNLAVPFDLTDGEVIGDE